MSAIPVPSMSFSLTTIGPQKKRTLHSIREDVWRHLQHFRQLLKKDWRESRYGLLGLILLLSSSVIVIAYYTNHPNPEVYSDTAEYLAAAQHIITSGKLVDPMRLPGFPLLITLVFLVVGQGNLAAVSIVQGILFVIAVLEIYVITCMVTRRAWIGLIVGLAVASNTYLLASIKPILSEGISLWVITSLALAFILLIRTFHIRYFWLLAGFTLAAFMTRPEWVYGPALFFSFLLLVAARHGKFRRFVPHVIAAVLVLYGVLGVYIYENATLNGYAGVSVVQRINLLGKVMQYNMQNEAPPQYAALSQEVDAYKKTGGISPYAFADLYPEVSANHWALADAYATAIVEHHPIEYVLKTIPVTFSSLTAYEEDSIILPQGPFGKQLLIVENTSFKAMFLYRFFPVFALVWLGLLLWRRTKRPQLVEVMGALSLISLYELVLTTTGGYESYGRLHTAFDPLMLVVICGSLLLSLAFLARRMMNLPVTGSLARLWPRIWWLWGSVIVGGIVVSALLTLLRFGFAALLHLHTWSGYSFMFDHPIRSFIVLGLLALFTYYIYQAHRLQALGSASGKTGSDFLPDQDAASFDNRTNPIPGEASLARPPDG